MTRPGRLPTGRRLVLAATAMLVAMAMVPGCEDKESTSGDGGGREAPSSEPMPSEPGASPPRNRPSSGEASSEAPDRPRPTGTTNSEGPGRSDDDGRTTREPIGRTGPQFGVVYHGMWDMTWSERAELLDKLAATGATWVRIGVQWSALQPNRPTAGDPGWSMGWGVPKADRVIDQAVQRGLKVSVTFHRTPDWANGGLGPEQLPTDPSSYAQAVRWLAHRYRDKVYSWEIWNEPNNANHLSGASVTRYVRLLCAAYPAVHHGDSTTKVVFGGTSGVDWEYIDAAYNAGAKPCFDVLAVHPYNSDVSPVPEAPSPARWWWRNVELVRDVMRQHHDRATPVWFTEFGWSSHANTSRTPSYERGVTYEQQAQYAVQMLRITRRQYGYVERVAWYAARDETTSTLENNNFGLFTLDLEPKPAAIELRGFLASR